MAIFQFGPGCCCGGCVCYDSTAFISTGDGYSFTLRFTPDGTIDSVSNSLVPVNMTTVTTSTPRILSQNLSSPFSSTRISLLITQDVTKLKINNPSGSAPTTEAAFNSLGSDSGAILRCNGSAGWELLESSGSSGIGSYTWSQLVVSGSAVIARPINYMICDDDSYVTQLESDFSVSKTIDVVLSNYSGLSAPLNGTYTLTYQSGTTWQYAVGSVLVRAVFSFFGGEIRNLSVLAEYSGFLDTIIYSGVNRRFYKSSDTANRDRTGGKCDSLTFN